MPTETMSLQLTNAERVLHAWTTRAPRHLILNLREAVETMLCVNWGLLDNPEIGHMAWGRISAYEDIASLMDPELAADISFCLQIVHTREQIDGEKFLQQLEGVYP